MKLSNNMYDVLAFIGRVLLPAIAAAYGSLADIWNLPYKTEIVTTIGVVATLIVNIFLQEVAKNYHAAQKIINKEQNINVDKPTSAEIDLYNQVITKEQVIPKGEG